MAVPSLEELIQLLGYGGAGLDQNSMIQAENSYQGLVSELNAIANLEAVLNNSYEKQFGYLQDDREKSKRRLLDAMANRGTLRSGLTGRGLNEQEMEFSKQLDSLVSARDQGLSEAATRRTNANSNFGSSLSSIQSAAAQANSENLTRQLIAEAERRQQQQQIEFQGQQNLQQQNFLNSILQAQPTLTAPQPVAPTNPLPAPKPPQQPRVRVGNPSAYVPGMRGPQ